jgi:hypothetical protein
LVDKLEGLLAEFWPLIVWERDFWKRARHSSPPRRKRQRAVAVALRKAARLLDAEYRDAERFFLEEQLERTPRRKVVLSRFIDDAEKIAGAIDEASRGVGGRPSGKTAENVARLVAAALHRDGVRCTTYDNGTLANVLGILFPSLGLPERDSFSDILQKVVPRKPRGNS